MWRKKYPQGPWQSVRLERNTPGCKHYTTEWDWVMASGFNTRCNPQLLWAIIRPDKQLREIPTARTPQGQKVKETLFSFLCGCPIFRNMLCKNCNSDAHWKSMFCINEQPKAGCKSEYSAWQLYVKALRARFAWDDIPFTRSYEALSLSIYAPLPPPPPFSTDRPHRNTENNLTCSAMGLSSQGFQWELTVFERNRDKQLEPIC